MNFNSFSRFLSVILIILMVLEISGCNSTDVQPVNDNGQDNAEKEEGYAGKLFDTAYVHTIDIVISQENWDDLIANPLDKTKYKVDVTIDGETIEQVSFATKGNTSLSSVASDPDSNRYSFKINFGKYVDDQTYYGLNKLNLNNIYADATYMKDYISYEIFRQAGVASPLVSYVWLTINGQDHGLYIAIEDISESYLERVNNGEGVLYKPESEQLANMNEGGQQFEPGMGDGEMTPPGGMPPGMDGNNGQPMPPGQDFGNNDQMPGAPGGENGMPGEGMTPPDGMSPPAEMNPGNWGQNPGMEPGNMVSSTKGADLKYIDDEISSYSEIFDNNETSSSSTDQQRVVEALKNLSENNDLKDFLDTDEIIRYFVAHNFVLNYDSYTGNMLHNYYLYEKDGKLSMLPWDYNLAFGAFANMGPQMAEQPGDTATLLINTGIDTPLSGVSEVDRPMWSWIVSDEKYLKQYHEAYDELLNTFFESGKFADEIDALYEMILPYVEKDPSAFYTADEFKKACETLKKLCIIRSESIRAQLNGNLSTETAKQDEDKQIDASDISIQDMGSHGNGQQNQPERPDGANPIPGQGGPMPQNR